MVNFQAVKEISFLKEIILRQDFTLSTLNARLVLCSIPYVPFFTASIAAYKFKSCSCSCSCSCDE